MGWEFSARNFVLGIVVGAVITLVLLAISTFIFLRSSSLYSLGHWKLNIRTPLPSMWMNLGYWRTYDGKPIVHFSEATRSLLERIVGTAGLLAKNEPKTKQAQESLAVLDLGFGCGDQTIALAEMVQARDRPHFKYVGLSLEALQVQAAQRTLDRTLHSNSPSVCGLDPSSFKLFCANAAQPKTWNTAIRESVDSITGDEFSQRWMLALDCLYHFSPSRRPAFKLAAGTLGANLMAFDLVLNDNVSRWNTALVRIAAYFLSCPLDTLMTEEKYREQLVECGYDGEEIEIQDISENVFAGVSGFLRKQEAALSQYGIDIGGYKLAGRLFEWFDRSKVVKAVIVVARAKRDSTGGN